MRRLLAWSGHSHFPCDLIFSPSQAFRASPSPFPTLTGTTQPSPRGTREGRWVAACFFGAISKGFGDPKASDVSLLVCSSFYEPFLMCFSDCLAFSSQNKAPRHVPSNLEEEMLSPVLPGLSWTPRGAGEGIKQNISCRRRRAGEVDLTWHETRCSQSGCRREKRGWRGNARVLFYSVRPGWR